MITDRYKKNMLQFQVIIFVAIITCIISTVQCSDGELTTTTAAEQSTKKMPEDEPEARDSFSPRVDYNEWMPVGRGDPLKNDPTYDYSPPVLNRVRYWASSPTNDSSKNEQTQNAAAIPSSALAKEKSDNKNEILLLGVPSKRQSYRKETKYQQQQQQQQHQQLSQNTVRRSYYVIHHNLPTRLMPPPMQTIAPLSTSSINGKPVTTEAYQSQYHHHLPSINPYMTTSSVVSSATTTSGLIASSSYQQNPTWIYNKKNYDSKLDESAKYVSITKPEISLISSAPSAAGMMKQVSNDFHQSSSSQQPQSTLPQQTPAPLFIKRKPWIHELLQKEISKPTTTAFVSTSPVKVIHQENHHYYHHTPAPVINLSTSSLDEIRPIILNSIKTTTDHPNLSHFQPTSPPVEMTTDSLFSHYKQPEKPLHGPMYLIIEGHSKVKTYGLKDNATTIHKAKIRPISVKDEDAIIKHVVSKDDNGKEMEIKHLHKKPSIENNLHLNENLIEKETTSITKLENVKPDPGPISNLLTLLDNSFVGFFSDENSADVNNLTNSEHKTEIEKPQDEMIFVTTQVPLKNDLKESRQIFDYDQLTESSILDFFGGDYDDDDDEEERLTENKEPNSKYLMDKFQFVSNSSRSSSSSSNGEN